VSQSAADELASLGLQDGPYHASHVHALLVLRNDSAINLDVFHALLLESV